MNELSTIDQPVSFGERLHHHAKERDAANAVTVIDGRTGEGLFPTTASWMELDGLVDRAASVVLAHLARVPETEAPTKSTVVGIGLRNGMAHIVATLACWRAGVTVLPFDPAQPAARADDVLRRAGARFAVVEDGMAADATPTIERIAFERAAMAASAAHVVDRVPRPGKIMQSGGSTGTPKLMADDLPWARVPGRSWGKVAPALGFRPNQTQLVAAAMSHNAALTWAQMGLFEGHRLIVLESFDAERAMAAIETHRVEFLLAVPTMMVRMADLPRIEARDFSSLVSFYHTGAPCAAWLKRRWIEILGPDRIFEMYGSGENVGQTIIAGRDWLAHPHSVGRPFETEVRVRDAEGRQLPPGEVGELFMRRVETGGAVRYLDPAQQMRVDGEGFTSIGDMAFVDADGWVHLAGRRDDVINTGGVKVHPEKIEAALLSHPSVRDVVVVGAPNRDWGEQVHAVVELEDQAPEVDLAALRRHCADQLAAAEMPKGLTIVAALPRDGFGKVRRRAVAAVSPAETKPRDV